MSITDSTSNYSGGGNPLGGNSSFSMMNSSRISTGGGRQGATGKGGQANLDKCVQRYECEDSVVGVEWSGADAWVFAALSYNGIFCINSVPSKEKYRILL